MGLKGCVSLRCKIVCVIKRHCDCPKDMHSLPVHFRKTIESLGPTFVKFGQLLSLRPDVIPQEYCDELRKLQDEVPGFGFTEVKQIIEEQTGVSLYKSYKSFDRSPIAAASIAQVHKAVLKNGKKVAVKVLRPGIANIIHQDIRILEMIAHVLEDRVPESRLFRPRKFIEEFKDWTLREIDFRNEARVMEEMRSSFAENPLIKIPQVYDTLSAERAFTMEFIDGVRVTDQAGIKNLHLDAKKLAVNAMQLIVEQTLVHGLFHGDPHPGNILALRGNRYGFLDFGIIGRLSERQRRKLSLYLLHLFQRDIERALGHILDLAELSDESDKEGFKRRAMDILNMCYGRLGHNSLSEALFRCVIAGVPYKVYFPSDLVLLSKAFVTAESVGREVYPDFSLLVDAREPVERVLKQQLLPTRTISNLLKNSLDASEIIEDLPLHAQKVLNFLEKGEVAVRIDKKEFSGYIDEIHKANNVRIIGMIVAALVVGSAITAAIQSDVPQHMLSLPMVELYAALLLGAYLLIYMKKTRR